MQHEKINETKMCVYNKFYSTFILHDVYWKVKLERIVDGTCMMTKYSNQTPKQLLSLHITSLKTATA